MNASKSTQRRNKGVRPHSSPSPAKEEPPVSVESLYTEDQKRQAQYLRAREILIATKTPEPKPSVPFGIGWFGGVWAGGGGCMPCMGGRSTGYSARSAGQLPM